MYCSLPSSIVHRIFWTRTLEWVAISSSRGSSPPRDQTHISCIGRQILYCWANWEALCCAVFCLVAQSCLTLCNPMDCSPPGSSVHGNSPGKNTGVGCHASRGSSQPSVRTQVSCLEGRFFYSLNRSGSPRILEWVAIPFSRGSSLPRNQTGVSCIIGRFFTTWATRVLNPKWGY